MSCWGSWIHERNSERGSWTTVMIPELSCEVIISLQIILFAIVRVGQPNGLLGAISSTGAG